MEKELKLTQIEGYVLTASTDDRSGGKTVGYYRNKNSAIIDSKGIGYWDSNGKVTECILYTDTDDNLYTVQNVGQFIDNEKYSETITNKILSKLTTEEIEYLGIK